MEPSATDEVLIRREGRAGRITMNRPKALNALTHAMVGRIWEALLAWRDDPAVELVLLDGAGDRGLCAGGDVRSLYESRTQGSGLRQGLLARRVPAQRADRPLPQAVCGAPGRHRHGRRHRALRPRPAPHRHGALAARHARDRHRPDPRRGRHVAAGARAGRGRHLPGPDRREHAGCRCHPCPLRRRLRPVGQAARAGRAAQRPRGRRGRRRHRGICRGRRVPPSWRSAPHDIDRVFAGATVEAIVEWRWRALAGDWAAKARAALAQKSPKSLKLTLAAVRGARQLPSLEEALRVEYRLTVRLFEDGEFPEGVRALIVDKDRKPQLVAARPCRRHGRSRDALPGAAARVRGADFYHRATFRRAECC